MRNRCTACFQLAEFVARSQIARNMFRFPCVPSPVPLRDLVFDPFPRPRIVLWLAVTAKTSRACSVTGVNALDPLPTSSGGVGLLCVVLEVGFDVRFAESEILPDLVRPQWIPAPRPRQFIDRARFYLQPLCCLLTSQDWFHRCRRLRHFQYFARLALHFAVPFLGQRRLLSPIASCLFHLIHIEYHGNGIMSTY